MAEEIEREPTYDTPDAGLRKAGMIIVALVAVALVIGYVVSQSYTQYPYTVNVSGTFIAKDGAVAVRLARPACNGWFYERCPDPGEQPVYDCFASPNMNQTNWCVTYDLSPKPGLYRMPLRNGENYQITASMVNSSGAFKKVCIATITLSPMVDSANSTQNLTC